jgi:hypothetical protein
VSNRQKLLESVTSKERSKVNESAENPIALARWLLLYSREGDVVHDHFASTNQVARRVSAAIQIHSTVLYLQAGDALTMTSADDLYEHRWLRKVIQA